MVFIIVPSISIISLILSKLILGKWLNHLSIYVFIWTILILTYELKLLPYPTISSETWFVVGSSYFAFFLGIITIFTARKKFGSKVQTLNSNRLSIKLFADEGRTLKYATLFFSFISLFSAVQHWMVLINMFGSIPAVLLNTTTIYQMQVRREITEFIPYLPLSGYIAIFFASIYTVYRGKISIIIFLPFLGIIFKEIATSGRAGILFALLEFVITFLYFKYLLNELQPKKIFSKKHFVFATLLLAALLIISTSFIKVTRIASENYRGASQELKQLNDNLIISPSIYLYFSADLGVLNQYLKSDGEYALVGQNTFLPLYDFLTKLKIVEKQPDLQKGYFIPMWVNTGTYIRELYADFGVFGIFLIPYLLGLFITFFWFRFFTYGKIKDLLILVYMNILIVFSFFVMFSRVGYWFYSFILLLIILPVVEKIAIFNSLKLRN